MSKPWQRSLGHARRAALHIRRARRLERERQPESDARPHIRHRRRQRGGLKP